MSDMNSTKRIGFVSTRLSGTDGVSLETVKWAKVFTGLGHECFFFAGESEWPEERSYVVPEAHFNHPVIQKLTLDLFDDYVRAPETSADIEKIKNHLKEHLHKFVRQFDLDLLVAENAMAIPMNVPLGLALTELVAETCLPTIGHHHDFAWERSRYIVSAGQDYQRAAFPPMLPSVRHVVINSYAQRQLALRTGASSTLVPNVMDFESPPPDPDSYTKNLRTTLDVAPGDYLLLQPTRVVPRKRIERAIELVKRLELPCTLVISHASGDEGSSYSAFLQEYIELMGVKVCFAAGVFDDEREQNSDGSKIYSLADGYRIADLVTYPSTVEGFGNAFLEAVYYCSPIVLSTYEIYRRDIQPKGFKVIEFGDYITEDTIRRCREVLSNPGVVAEMVAHNYQVARRHYSYSNLEKLLVALLDQSLGN